MAIGSQEREKVFSSEQPNPPSITVIGGGEVTETYLLRAQRAGVIRIRAILSRQSRAAFLARNPAFEGTFIQVLSDKETVSVLEEQTEDQDVLNVVVATPAEGRPGLEEKILERIKNEKKHQVRLFSEKPYAASREDLGLVYRLLHQFPGCIYLSQKYVKERALRLYDQLQPGRIPTGITVTLIEGGKYWRAVKESYSLNGKHQFLDIGPEGDLGIHAVGIGYECTQKFGDPENPWYIQALEAHDLNEEIPHEFEKGWGVAAKLKMYNSKGNEVDLQVRFGKGDTTTKRGCDVYYSDGIVRQIYPPGGLDPIMVQEKGIWRFRGRHAVGYDYFARELKSAFGRQSIEEQFQALYVNSVCFDIKDIRQGLITSPDLGKLLRK